MSAVRDRIEFLQGLVANANAYGEKSHFSLGVDNENMDGSISVITHNEQHDTRSANISICELEPDEATTLIKITFPDSATNEDRAGEVCYVSASGANVCRILGS